MPWAKRNCRLIGVLMASPSSYLKNVSIFIVGILFGGGLVFAVVKVLAVEAPPSSVDISGHPEIMYDCIQHVLTTIAPNNIRIGNYQTIWRLCGNQIYNNLILDDFIIRREKFIRQELDERVNLWLVVAITISGVLMSALQLFMSYRLAQNDRTVFAKDSELAIEAGRISLKSSITGLLILTISLAFFMIYVIYIYSIREVPINRPENLQTPVEREEPPDTGPKSTLPLSTDSPRPTLMPGPSGRH
jgi:hypothetical protein